MALIKRKPKKKIQNSTLYGVMGSKPNYLVRTSSKEDFYIGRGKHKSDKYPLAFMGKTKRYNRRHKIYG